MIILRGGGIRAESSFFLSLFFLSLFPCPPLTPFLFLSLSLSISLSVTHSISFSLPFFLSLYFPVCHSLHFSFSSFLSLSLSLYIYMQYLNCKIKSYSWVSCDRYSDETVSTFLCKAYRILLIQKAFSIIYIYIYIYIYISWWP